MVEEMNKQQDGKGRGSKKPGMGDIIQILKGEAKGKQGKVIVLRENSVIVEIGVNSKTDEPIKTVVNHKNYKLI
ncbi:DUF2187 family protein [Cytobacillus praedii]|uniref:DUF2187 family protein n=1 Tax=Cytobacillus praedii TaxID=1742358 RepID=UPI002E1EDD25|nr:DUF2187 family protein [Cytobacillus praedii]